MGDSSEAATSRFITSGPIALVTVDMDSVIAFANGAACELLERDLEGVRFLDLVHPDDRRRVAAGSTATVDPRTIRRRRGAVWRMVLPDGSALEVLAHTARAEIDGVLYGQIGFLPAPPRLAVLKALEAVAGAKPLDETLEILIDGIRTDESGIAVNWVAPDGAVHIFGNLDPILAGVDGRGNRDRDPASVWFEAAAQKSPARREELDSVRPEVAAAAEAAGYRAVCVSPITDPASGLALLYVNWVPHPSHLDYVEQTFADVLADVLRIALERADHGRQLHEAAHHDQLTGLANRRAFFPVLADAIAEGAASVLYLDLDEFKPVNDRLGHDVGDLILIGVAERLSAFAPATAMVARLGGDEFAIALPGDDGHGARAVAERLVAEIGKPFDLPGHGDVSIGVSVGFASTDSAGDADPNSLLLAADEALRRAKGEGKGTWVRARRPG